MALITPIIPPIGAFDATKEYIISFDVPLGGDQVTANEIVIKNNVTNEEVYRHTDYPSYVYLQSIPANTLQNGIQYNVSVRTFNADAESSQWSTPDMFYCYEHPTTTFSVSQGDIFSSSTITMQLTYNQPQGDLMNFSTIELYDMDENLIESSGELYNQSPTMPVSVAYTFTGLINDNDYIVRYYTESVSGLSYESPDIQFKVHYTDIVTDAPVIVKSHNCDGYVSVSSKLSFIFGKTSPSDPVYVNNDAIDLVDTFVDWEENPLAPTVNFHEGYEILPNDGFTFRLWFNPAFVNNKIATLYGEEDTNEKVTIKYVRGRQHDFVVAESTEGAYVCSNGINHCNGNSYLYLFLNCDGEGHWNCVLTEISKIQTIWRWNDDTSNVKYNFTTDMAYDVFESYTPSDSPIQPLNAPITNINLGNGYFYKLVVDELPMAYTDVEPMGFDEHTLLYCNFDGNLKAGTANVPLSEIKGFKIKRKDYKVNRWIELYNKNIQPNENPVKINYKDYTVPYGIEQSYALVPTMNGGIEGNYISNTITPKWNFSFISDDTDCFSLEFDISYGGEEQNVPIGVFNPIGNKYPIVVQNGTTNYLSGSITAKLLGYNFNKNKYIDRIDVVKQKEDFIKFMSNGKAKVFKDWNGNILILRRTSNQIGYEKSYANGIVEVSFAWVEQGSYDDEQSLREAGIIK